MLIDIVLGSNISLVSRVYIYSSLFLYKKLSSLYLRQNRNYLDDSIENDDIMFNIISSHGFVLKQLFFMILN